MDKKKAGAKVEVPIDLTKTQNNLNDKSMFIKSAIFGEYFFDSNFTGNVFIDKMNRGGYQKWEFVNAGSPGVYYIRNAQTQFVLSSNAKGDIFTDLLQNASTQQWIIIPYLENAIIRNFSNEFVLELSSRLLLYTTNIDEKKEYKTFLWKISAARGEPRK